MPVEQPPLVIGAGPRPFRTKADVVAHLDELLQDGEVAPIRDALMDALTALLFELQFRGEYAIAQADLLRATQGYLTSLGGDDHRVPRAPGEEDEDYRTRLLTIPATVTEESITLGVNVLLAPFTSTECQLFDGVLDRFFVQESGSSAAQWRSFIGATPEYHDRLFAGQEPSNDGYARPNSDPGGARIGGDHFGREFYLLLPDLIGFAEPSPVWDTSARVFDAGFFVGDHTVADVLGLPGFRSSSVDSLYRAIEGFVNSVAGQSIRWGFFAELEAA
jgi:hypothetical protein